MEEEKILTAKEVHEMFKEKIQKRYNKEKLARLNQIMKERKRIFKHIRKRAAKGYTSYSYFDELCYTNYGYFESLGYSLEHNNYFYDSPTVINW